MSPDTFCDTALVSINTIMVLSSGVARAFPGGRLAHPEVQNEEENEETLRKN